MLYLRFPILVAASLLLAGCDDASERAVHHHDRGLELLETGHPKKAALEFRNALRHDEGYVAARFQLARLLEDVGDLNGAVANLRAIIETNPAHVSARIRLANAMLIAGAPKQAIEHAEVAVRAAPDLPEALLARALAAYRLGDTRLSIKDVTRALILDPGNADAGLMLALERHDSGDTTKALKLLDQFIQRNPTAIALQVTKLGFLDQAEDHTAIGTVLRQMVRQFPNRVDARESLVQWHLRNDDVEAAQDELSRIQSLLPDEVAPILARVKLHARVDGKIAARKVFETEIAAFARPDALRLELARFDLETGAADRAADLLRQLINSQAPEQIATDARMMLASIYSEHEDFDAVDAETSTVLENDPGNADAMALRALAHLRRDNLEDALFDIRNALAENPEDARQLALAAEIYRRNGSPRLAGESMASAVRAGNFAPHLTLAYSKYLRETGQAVARETLLQEAVRKQPGTPEIMSELARIHLENREWSSAEALLQALSKLDPGMAAELQARLVIARGGHDAAFENLGETQSNSDTLVTLTIAKVQTYLSSGDPTAASNLITKGLESRPDDVTLLKLKGSVHEIQGLPGLAETTYRKLINVAPGSDQGYAALAALLQRLGRRAEARHALELGLRKVPNPSNLRLLLASLNLRQGEVDAAVAQFELIYAAQPDSDLAANNLASALAEFASDDPAQIARAERIARRLAGSANPAFMDTYGWTRVLSGDAASGAEALQAAAKGLPDNPWVRYHAGVAFWHLRQSDRARAHFQAALRLTSGQPFQPRDQITQLVADLSD